MDLKEISDKSKKMIANFINEIGLDGEFYTTTCNCQMTWGKPMFDGCGEFVAPDSVRLKGILKSVKGDEKVKEGMKERGLILVNQMYAKQDVDSDLYITIIHEIFHSNRNLLLFDATRDNKNENAYSFDNNKFEQNTPKYDFNYADASQETLKGSIDTSRKTVNSYKNKSSDEIEDLEWAGAHRDSQMERQQCVDEALVELMAKLANNLYTNKELGKDTDIWREIEEISEHDEQGDIVAMCKIILKHHDFELFNWMIDPITYSNGDIHYDFFGEYTQGDQELVSELYEAVGIDIEAESEILKDAASGKIDMEDIKNVATSQIAMEELEDSLQDITNTKKRTDIETVR